MENCSKCGGTVEADELRTHHGKALCEDCYLDLVFQPKTCDPWSVHSAKSLEKHGTTVLPLTDRQQRLLGLLKETGGMRPDELALRLDISSDELEREIAALRHMEKVRGELREGTKYIRLW